MRICIIFGHHNTQNSFNAAVRDTFIDEAKKNGHDIDLINLFNEEQQKLKNFLNVLAYFFSYIIHL